MTTFSITRRRGLGALAAGALAPWGSFAKDTPVPRIVASFSILADIASQIAPPGAEVTALVGPDADAHVFEPRPTDGKRLAQTDLVVINGLGFEGWIDRLVKASGYRGPVAVLSEGVATRRSDASPQAMARATITTMARSIPMPGRTCDWRAATSTTSLVR